MENIVKMMKFCSKMNEIIDYPFFFNWSAPTNHRDNTPDGEINDVSYVILRLGIYPHESSDTMVEKTLFFGHVNRIVDFTPFNMMLLYGQTDVNRDDYPIKSFEDVEKHKEALIIAFTESMMRYMGITDVELDGPEL